MNTELIKVYKNREKPIGKTLAKPEKHNGKTFGKKHKPACIKSKIKHKHTLGIHNTTCKCSQMPITNAHRCKQVKQHLDKHMYTRYSHTINAQMQQIRTNKDASYSVVCKEGRVGTVAAAAEAV